MKNYYSLLLLLIFTRAYGSSNEAATSQPVALEFVGTAINAALNRLPRTDATTQEEEKKATLSQKKANYVQKNRERSKTQQLKEARRKKDRRNELFGYERE